MATTTVKQEKNLADASWLEQYLYGGRQQQSLIDPELKKRLIRRGLIAEGTSDADALNWWNRNVNTLNSEERTHGVGGTKHDLYEDDFEEYWSGDKSATTTQTVDYGKGRLQQDYEALDDMLRAWGGDTGALGRNKSIADALAAQNELSTLLTQMRETGGLPTERDISSGRDYASKIFGGQRERLSQTFSDLDTQYSRRAASMGRDVLDPILQAKMGQEKSRQAGVLNADEAAAAQQYAAALPGQRLSYQQMMVDLKGGLAQQAWNNRAALLGAGVQLGGAERQFRINTAPVTSTQETSLDFADWLNMGIGAGGKIIGMGTDLFGSAPKTKETNQVRGVSTGYTTGIAGGNTTAMGPRTFMTGGGTPSYPNLGVNYASIYPGRS